jgi:hypothetical protein
LKGRHQRKKAGTRRKKFRRRHCKPMTSLKPPATGHVCGVCAFPTQGERCIVGGYLVVCKECEDWTTVVDRWIRGKRLHRTTRRALIRWIRQRNGDRVAKGRHWKSSPLGRRASDGRYVA